MTSSTHATRRQQKPLRLWPGLVAAMLLIMAKFIVPLILPDALLIVMFGGLLSGLLIIIWWAFFSRAPRLDRFGGVLLMIVLLVAVRPLLHPSIAKAGQGMLFPILAIPILALAFAGWAVVSRFLSPTLRRTTMVITILFAVGSWALLRSGGLNNDGQSDFDWRWTATPEQELLQQFDNQSTAPLSVAAVDSEITWAGFRGALRNGIVQGVQIETDWAASPPVELWRQPVGPGWSSFAVMGKVFYTQEQRGEEETVTCYSLESGELVWLHGDKARFWESNAGAGPRGTPTLHNGRVYSFGATGILNVLDAFDGSRIWSRNAAKDTDTQTPIWGFSSSPLIVDDMVIVSPAGSMIAYDLQSGEPRWSIEAGGDCYSSPHLLEIGGIPQVLLQNKAGTCSVNPINGSVLWEHAWEGNPIVQPVITPDGDVLISATDRSGMRRIAVSLQGGSWTTKERWTSDRVKPYFNDSVLHKGHVYGFDGPSLACVDVVDGVRRWRGGRYGRGQFILLADQNILIVLSEKGELALVQAIPDEFGEITRVPAIEGKTWNHPVLVGDVLLVRNAEEMAAYRLPVSKL